MKIPNTAKRLSTSIVVIIALALCLAVTTLALVYSMVTVEDNLFFTGTVQINLNDGKPVVADRELLVEPGMRIQKTFFLQNESSCDVYYKLYFRNVSGGLADVLQVQILDGDRVLFSGTPRELTRDAVGAADDILRLEERRELTVRFYFPEHIGNEAQDQFLQFDIAADAVQTKNNPLKEFE